MSKPTCTKTLKRRACLAADFALALIEDLGARVVFRVIQARAWLAEKGATRQ